MKLGYFFYGFSLLIGALVLSQCGEKESAAAAATTPQATTVPDVAAKLNLAEAWLAAAGKGDVATLQQLVAEGCFINTMDARGNTALALAAEAGHTACVEYLLSLPGTIIKTYNTQARTPLDTASPNCRLLLENRLEALRNKQDQLLHAAQNGTPAAILDLLSVGHGLPEAEWLKIAAMTDHAELMHFLLSVGCDPNANTGHGITPLHIAAANNSTQALQLLLMYGARATAFTPSGYNALHVAEHNCAEACAALLQQHKPNQTRRISAKTRQLYQNNHSNPFIVEMPIAASSMDMGDGLGLGSGNFDDIEGDDLGAESEAPGTEEEEEAAEEQTTEADSDADEMPVEEEVDEEEEEEEEDIDISIPDTEEEAESVVIYDEREERNKAALIYAHTPLHGGLGSTESAFSALEGTFYDLKKYKNGRSTGINGGWEEHDRVIEALAESFRFDAWDAAALDQYYQANTRLYAAYWYLPGARANYAPLAFGVGNADKPVSQWECKPSAWVAVYRGKVLAPVTGKFRFIGTGDDFLAVRFGGKTVLDAGYRLPTRWDAKNPRAAWVSGSKEANAYHNAIAQGKDPQRKHYQFIKGIPGCSVWDAELGGLTAGTPFDVTEGEAYDIEIAIAEIPGGIFGFVLFIEQLDAEGKPWDTTPGKKYDLFRTSTSNPAPESLLKELKDVQCHTHNFNIPFNEDAYVWEVIKD